MSVAGDARGGRSTTSNEWRQGAWPLISATVAFGAGTTLIATTASAFVNPIAAATGWPTAQVLISPIITGLFFLCGPMWGRVIDRIDSARPVTIIGMSCYILIIVLFISLPISHAIYYTFAAAIGIAGSTGYMVPMNRTIATWFQKNAGFAFGILGAGGNGVPVLALPPIIWATYTYNYRIGYLVVALICLFIALPAVAWGLKSKKVDASQDVEIVLEDKVGGIGIDEGSAASAAVLSKIESRVEAKRVLRTFRFWLIPVALLFAGGTTAAVSANAQPITLDAGRSVVEATSITTALLLGAVLGRLGAGLLLDRFNRYVVYMGLMLLAALGAFVAVGVAHEPYWLVFAAMFCLGTATGIEGDAVAYLVLRDYGRASYGILFGFSAIGTGIGGIFGSYAFAFVHDAFGNYAAALFVGGFAFILSGLIVLLFAFLGRREKRRLPAFAEVGVQQSADAPEVS